MGAGDTPDEGHLITAAPDESHLIILCLYFCYALFGYCYACRMFYQCESYYNPASLMLLCFIVLLLCMSQVWSMCYFSTVTESCQGCWIWKDDPGAGGYSANNSSRSANVQNITFDWFGTNLLGALEITCEFLFVCRKRCPCKSKDRNRKNSWLFGIYCTSAQLVNLIVIVVFSTIAVIQLRD